MSNSMLTEISSEDDTIELVSPDSDIEAEVQQVFTYLESLRPEVQNLVCERLLSGFAAQSRSVTKKALTAAKRYSSVQSKADHPKLTESRPRSRPSGAGEVAILHPRLSVLNDPADPIEAIEKMGGLEQLTAILPTEPLGVLEAMARHTRMPSGPVKSKSKVQKKLAEAIIRHLQEHLEMSN